MSINPKPWTKEIRHGNVHLFDANGAEIARVKEWDVLFYNSDDIYHAIDCAIIHDPLRVSLRKALSEACDTCDDHATICALGNDLYPPCDRELGGCYLHEAYKTLREAEGEADG